MKKRKILLVLAVCLLGFFRLQAAVSDGGECGNGLTWTFEDTLLTITGTGAMDNFFDLESPWEDYRLQIKKVIIKEGAISVGRYAFRECTSLTSVDLPKSITRINMEAFKGCTGLTSFICRSTAPPGLDGNVFDGVDLTKITLYVPSKDYEGVEFFRGMIIVQMDETSLKSITVSSGTLSPEFNPDTTDYTVIVPYSVKNITFEWETNLFEATVKVNRNQDTLSVGGNRIELIVTSLYGSTVKIYNVEVTRLPADAATLKIFTLDRGILSPAYHPDSVNYTVDVGTSVSIIEITAVPVYPQSTVSGDGRYLLYVGDNIVDVKVTAEDGLTTKTYSIKIHKTGSGTCGDNLDNLTWHLGNGVLTVDGAGKMKNYLHGGAPWYSHRTLIKRLIIEEGVKSIGQYAFIGCTDLTSVVIPSSLSSIGEYAFTDCFGMDSIINRNPEPQAINKNVFLNDTISNITLCVPYGYANKYKSAAVWKDFEIMEEEPQPPVTVIPSVGAPSAQVYNYGGILHVDTPAAERIHIYSVTGKFLYGMEKLAGKTSFVINTTGERILIVKGSSGWVRKVIL